MGVGFVEWIFCCWFDWVNNTNLGIWGSIALYKIAIIGMLGVLDGWGTINDELKAVQCIRGHV